MAVGSAPSAGGPGAQHGHGTSRPPAAGGAPRPGAVCPGGGPETFRLPVLADRGLPQEELWLPGHQRCRVLQHGLLLRLQSPQRPLVFPSPPEARVGAVCHGSGGPQELWVPGHQPPGVCVSQLLLLRHHPQRALVLLPNPQSRLSLLRGVPSENPPASLGVWK